MPKQVPSLPNAPQPLAPYSIATEANGLVFISGQVAVDLTGGPTPADVVEQARLIMHNIGVILTDLGLGYSDIVKTSIFLADIADFGRINEVYGSFFPADPPARSTFQVAGLPRPEFKIEIETIASR
ncbi:MAG: Rid family detoxifying hydrolase [Acidimicrobiia bacterium]|nr:Rid family detoxifying hydrolase [Acidimicrobiia bacterium]